MIPFFDLAAQQAQVRRQIDENISKVLSHGKYILGPEVTELEDRLCEYTGAKYCITCANGTDALQISLMAIGVGPGDEVITPAFSYIATAEATALLGAKPVYVDVDPISFNIDSALIEEKITSKTKAIIPVSLYGQPCDFVAINEIARKYDLVVIEDAAQSFGGEYKEKKSCNLSDIGCTSFFPTKPLGCYGDGGAVFTSDEALSRSIRQVARHGQQRRYHHTVIGINSRLDTIQAAILLCKLELLDNEINARKHLADQIGEIIPQRNIIFPKISDKCKSAFAQFTVRDNDRDQLISQLQKKSIPSTVHYPLPLNKQQATRCDLSFTPNSDLLCKEVLSLPLPIYDSEVQSYINLLREVL